MGAKWEVERLVGEGRMGRGRLRQVAVLLSVSPKSHHGGLCSVAGGWSQEALISTHWAQWGEGDLKGGMPTKLPDPPTPA